MYVSQHCFSTIYNCRIWVPDLRVKKCFGATDQSKSTDNQHVAVVDDRGAGGGDDNGDSNDNVTELAKETEAVAAARAQVKESRGVITRAAFK